MKKVEQLVRGDFAKNPFGLAFYDEAECAFWNDLDIGGKVRYKRFNRRVERWIDGMRTHVVRAKITTDKWDAMIKLFEKEARYYALELHDKEQQAKREFEMMVQYNNEDFEEGYMKQGINDLIRELEIDFNDWKSWKYDENCKSLEFKDSDTDYCVYDWFPGYITRKENDRITNHFSVTILYEEWKELASLKELEDA